VGNLRITGLIGAHQAQPIAAQERRQAVGKEEDGKQKKDGRFANGGPTGQPSTPAL
jgi:hypothetical protein